MAHTDNTSPRPLNREAQEIGRTRYCLHDNNDLSIGRLSVRRREANAEAARLLTAHENPEPAAR